MQEDTENLVFNAKMITENPEEKARVFSISFNLREKKLSILEGKSSFCISPQRFLSPSTVIDPTTKSPYTESSFYIGSRIIAAGRLFELVDASDYTLSYMEAYPNRFPYTDVDLCFEYLKKVTENVQLKFQDANPAAFGTMPIEQAREVLYSFHPTLPKHASVTLLRRFSAEGRFNYQAVLEGANIC
ncbi:hypothetical protein TVAG_378020 [Trichomonas vaginalis G3]|uniref:DM10 domain-containing protein n=1 Tax=Trichomonas vaginalis (strain ATCC PRA-98 / G3) TaxID=412133 RepID=A2DAZ3_TRIV3|nr:alpha-tubulin binding [Trichomonas vaginalis G3]EAY22323.1 hypothetical protein TVAG_378020 [Trichomonas vaginalis G3]KAI5518263.1 alpha-tubulin binding [Trichomonas vaginalis G3]|eukprot:XP_001583309.1 hypothetical protein [Trichomonas vaginalis G3]